MICLQFIIGKPTGVSMEYVLPGIAESAFCRISTAPGCQFRAGFGVVDVDVRHIEAAFYGE